MFQFIEVCRHSFMQSSLKVPPQHLNQFAVWTLTGPLTRWFFSFSVILCVNLLLCLGSLFFCITQFLPCCQTDGFTSLSRILSSRCCGSRKVQIITTPLICLTTAKRGPNHFTLVLSNQRTLLQISYGFQETPQNGLLSWTFTFSILTEPQSLPCSYWDFSVHAWSNHWMNLLGPPPPRRLASVLNVFHFWKFVFTVE